MNQRKINEALLQCTDMLHLGSVQSGGLSSQQRVSNSMQYRFLVQSLLTEGSSKQHCSWVNVGDNDGHVGMRKGKHSFHDKSSKLYQVC